MIDVPRNIYLALKFALPLLWISGAIWVYMDAKNTNRDKRVLPAVAWFFVCLASCPIAIFVYWSIRKPKFVTIKMVCTALTLFGLVWLFQFSNVADMPRWARIRDEIDSDKSQLKVGVSKEQVIELIGKPENRSRQSVNQVRKVEVLEYRVGKGTAYFVFQSDTRIRKYYFETKSK
jgi:hypothetical protein